MSPGHSGLMLDSSLLRGPGLSPASLGSTARALNAGGVQGCGVEGGKEAGLPPTWGRPLLGPFQEPPLCPQVSHHPPVSAFHVSNRKDGFCVSGSVTAKSRFYGEGLP